MTAKVGTNRAVQAVVTNEQKQRFADALDRVAGDTELLIAIASLVSEDAPQVFENLKSQLAADELDEVAATGHQLKGMLSTFETEGPVLCLQELIHAARRGDGAETKELLHRCEMEINTLIHEIRQLCHPDD